MMADEKRLIWDEDAKRHLIALAVGHHTETLHIDMVLNAILHHTPTVDAVEVVHGRWEARTDVIGFVRCSVCHNCNIYDEWPDGKKWNYCPNCGAKMDGERREGE